MCAISSLVNHIRSFILNGDCGSLQIIVSCFLFSLNLPWLPMSTLVERTCRRCPTEFGSHLWYTYSLTWINRTTELFNIRMACSYFFQILCCSMLFPSCLLLVCDCFLLRNNEWRNQTQFIHLQVLLSLSLSLPYSAHVLRVSQCCKVTFLFTHN